ncbi:MAG: tetratricopeptide repeat protein [Desulfobulbus sp.]|jgi:tetratricopeptide (TPR) repeat protein|nr:tetratricopeptide repeat protein [Desulfobulbus sp.]
MPSAVRLVLARIGPLMTAKDYVKASEIIQTALAKKETRHPELFFALGNCLMLRGEQKAAIKAYTQAVTLDSGHSLAWLNLAKAYYEVRQYQEAGRCFARGYGADGGKQADTLYFSAAAYLMAGAYSEAITSFQQLFAAHAKAIKPEWREHYIHALISGGKSKQALPLIRELVAQATGDRKLQWQEILLAQYVQLRMHKEALGYSRELTDQQPGEARWWKALAHIQLSANHLEDAVATLTVYSYLKPLSREETRLLADLYLQAGIPVKAAPLYAQQLKSHPDAQVSLRLAMAYRQMDQADLALQTLESAKGKDTDPRLLMLQGELSYALNRYGLAADSYRQAARLRGSHQGQSWLMAGYAAMQGQDLGASREALTQAARFDKEKKAARLALDHINQSMVQ